MYAHSTSSPHLAMTSEYSIQVSIFSEKHQDFLYHWPNVFSIVFNLDQNLHNRFTFRTHFHSLQPQQLSRDDIGIKDDSSFVHYVSSPTTPRTLRLERVAQALAAQSSDELNAQTLLQHRSVAPVLLRYAC